MVMKCYKKKFPSIIKSILYIIDYVYVGILFCIYKYCHLLLIVRYEMPKEYKMGYMYLSFGLSVCPVYFVYWRHL